MKKFDLHRHLEGCHSPRALIAVARKHGVPGFDNDAQVLEASSMPAGADFADPWAVFIEKMDFARSTYVNANAIRDITALSSQEAALEAPDGFELRFSLFSVVKRYLKLNGRKITDYSPEALASDVGRPLMAAIVAGASTVPVARLRFGFSRALDPAWDHFEAIGLLAREYAPQLCGLDILGKGSGEIPEPLSEKLVSLIDRVRPDVNDLSVHAGEMMGPASVAAALQMKPNSIGHGIRALEDPKLVEQLAKGGTTLEVCITSNQLLIRDTIAKLTNAAGVHPLAALTSRGVRCILSTDDPAIFRTNLDVERSLASDLKLDISQLENNAESRWAELPVPPWSQ